MSVTILKRIALVTMALGYIGALIPGMPVFLQWIGKLSRAAVLLLHGLEPHEHQG